MKPLYISATHQDSGKTSITLGLMQILKDRELDVGYIKPVGQRYVRYKGKNIDEDAVLIYEVFGCDNELSDISPIAIEKGFTEKFILKPNAGKLEKQIISSANCVSKSHQYVMIEGTGHAGVGSCFGLSNARVAQLTDSQVIIITKGGIGKPIDEVALSLNLFRQHGVNVLGVILNKVLPEKLEKVRTTVAKGLEHFQTKLLGAVPYDVTMSKFTFGQIADEFDYEVLYGKEHLNNYIENIVVAAMEPENVLGYLKPNSLIITPGDRIDNILLALTLSSSDDFKNYFCCGGVILTGGLVPDVTILNLLRNINIPILTTTQDTYTVASRMKDVKFKIRSCDSDKIEEMHGLVAENVDIDYILNALEK